MRNLQNEEAFIAQVIQDWSERLTDLVLAALKKKKLGITEALEKSVRTQARQNVGELIFRSYGRMVDMGAGRGYNKGVEKISENRRRLTRKGRTPQKFYSKTAYGTLSGLMRDLVNTYSDKIVYDAKKQLEQ